MNLIYIVPLHNEKELLVGVLERILDQAQRLTPEVLVKVYLIENGSQDGSWELIEKLRPLFEKSPVRFYREARAGLGLAYRRGIEESLLEGHSTENDWLVLTAADLPFEFSDLDSFMRFLATGNRAGLIIGSKAHRESMLHTRGLRNLSSLVYRFLTRVLLGMRTKDPQGVLFLNGKIADLIVNRVRSEDFFFSTELTYIVEALGIPVEEVPVRYPATTRPSRVRLWADAPKMFFQLLKLRRNSHAGRGSLSEQTHP